MISKELRDGWWKFATVALLLLTFIILNTAPYGVLEEAVANAPKVEPDGSPMPEEFQITDNPVEYAMQEMSWIYGWYVSPLLAILAATLAVTTVSREVSQGTIHLLLSKPIGRTRLLLGKYAFGAGALLAVAVIGLVSLVVSAAVQGYPLRSLSGVGVALSTILIWLGSLSVLGGALLASVFFKDVFKSTIATVAVVYVAFAFPKDFLDYSLGNQYRALGLSEEFVRSLSLRHYWASESLFVGDSFALTSFLVCTIAALLPLLAALWLFNRKAY